MNEEIVTIRLPKKLCAALAELAMISADTETPYGSYAVASLLQYAAKKGEVELNDPVLLSMCEPYDETSDQFRLDYDDVCKEITDTLKR